MRTQAFSQALHVQRNPPLLCRLNASTSGFSSPHPLHTRLSDDEAAGDLLSEDDRGLAGSDEPVEDRPEVPFVVETFALSRRAERLAGAAPGPDGPCVVPSGPAKGV